jgi:outer membrane immunogenic protein
MRYLSAALIAAFAAAAITQIASAADMPRKAPVYSPPAAPMFTWTGCYIGGQVGYKWANSDPTWANSGNPAVIPFGTPLTANQHLDGVVGGVTAGCNYQWTPNWVVGIEGDYNWADLDSESPLLPPANTQHVFGIKEHSFATLRARAGYAVDRWLLFVSGGAAWARVETFDTNVGINFTISNTNTRTGWTVGGGVEYALTNNWLVKAEYLYTDLGTKRTFNNELGGEADVPLTQHLVRAGVNYKFW